MLAIREPGGPAPAGRCAPLRDERGALKRPSERNVDRYARGALGSREALKQGADERPIGASPPRALARSRRSRPGRQEQRDLPIVQGLPNNDHTEPPVLLRRREIKAHSDLRPAFNERVELCELRGASLLIHCPAPPPAL
jgi:hypothetical protein